MIRRYRVERHPDLIELSIRQFTTETVINDLEVRLRNFRGFFNPHIGQLSTLESNGFQLFTLFLIIDSTENDLIPVDLTLHNHVGAVDVPISLILLPKHTKNSTLQFCKSAIPVCHVRLSNA